MVATEVRATQVDDDPTAFESKDVIAEQRDSLVEDLVVELRANGGDLRKAGAYRRGTLSSIAKTFATSPDTEELTLDSIVDVVDERHLLAWMSAVEAAGPGRGIRVLHAEALIAFEPPKFLVEDVIEEGGSAVLYSPSGLGKTFVTLDLAASIACGVPWLGHSVEKGPVVYVAAEGAGGLNKRLEAWKTARGVEWLADLHVIPDAVNLMMMGDVVELIHRISDLDPALVIFDTYARCMVGGDESSAKDAGKAIDNLDRIRRETDAATLCIHHTDKKGTTERGSGALRRAVDTMIELEKPKSGLRLTCDKQRNAEPFASIPIRLTKVGDSLVPEIGSEPAAADGTATPSPYRTDIEEVLSKAYKDGLTPLSQNKVLEGVGGNNKRVTAELRSLAGDSSSPVSMAKKGRSYQYDWNPPSDAADTATSPPKGGGEGKQQ